jgi:hypothetical protein
MSLPTWFYDRTYIWHLNSNNRNEGEHEDFKIKIVIDNGLLKMEKIHLHLQKMVLIQL